MVTKHKILFAAAAISTLWWLLMQRHQEDPARSGKTPHNEQNQTETMLLAAVGDILLHREHQELAFKLASHKPLWAPIDDILGKVPHLLYGNLEGTSSPRSCCRQPANKFPYIDEDPLDDCKEGNNCQVTL